MAFVAACASLRGLRIHDSVKAGGIICRYGTPSSYGRPERFHTDKTVAGLRIYEWSWRSTFPKSYLLRMILTTVSQTSRCLSYAVYKTSLDSEHSPYCVTLMHDHLRTESGTAPALLHRKCTPCSSKDLQPLTKGAAQTLLEQVPGWILVDVDGKLQLKQSWKTKNFMKGLDLMKEIGEVAESEGHHPDLHLVNWNQLEVNISTHAIGGLSENDFILAAKINALNMEGFLRKRKSAPRTVTG